jgi:hypothetical protein
MIELPAQAAAHALAAEGWMKKSNMGKPGGVCLAIQHIVRALIVKHARGGDDVTRHANILRDDAHVAMLAREKRGAHVDETDPAGG